MLHSSLVRIATYDDPILAHLARNRLEAANLPTFLDGEHHVAMDWMISNAVGGIKLLVAIENRDEAMQILEKSHDIDDALNIASSVDCEQPCPECQSFETYRERLRRKAIFLSILILGIPLPIISRRIVCEACGHKWNPT